jgi:hypothetical protein
VDEYYQWIFENSVPGLPEAAAKEGLSPLAYMRKYGVFEVKKENYVPFEKVTGKLSITEYTLAENELVYKENRVIGVNVGGEVKVGFDTPSRKLEFFSPTLSAWGWDEAVCHSVVGEEIMFTQIALLTVKRVR